jgi:diguanylate cyclase (GGDEF)-like protein
VRVPFPDLLYFALRMALAGMTGWVATSGWRYALRSRLAGQAGMLPAAGALLLCAAAALSAFEAIDNVIFQPDAPIPVAAWLWFFLFDLPMPVWAFLALRARESGDRAYAELSRLSVTDQLTGILNRRGFFDRAMVAIAHSRRTGTSSALIMLDIDYFKAINDSHGHGGGDEVIKNVASTLSSKLRVGDLLGRMGGEEFGVLMSDATLDAATMTAERLRAAIHDEVPHPAGPVARVTISGGVAHVPDNVEPEIAFSLALKAADEYLYAGKHEGRDRIVTAIRASNSERQSGNPDLDGTAIATPLYSPSFPPNPGPKVIR